MWPYIVLIFVPILLQHIPSKYTVSESTSSAWFRRQNILYIRKDTLPMNLFWGLLLLLLLLRHESIGRDLPTYEYIFDYIKVNDWPTALGRSPEVAWSFMNKVVASLGGSFRWVIVLSAVLSIVGLARAYMKYTCDASLTIALFLTISNFVLLFSGLRQSIAISIGMLAFELVRRKKFLPFAIVTVLTMFVHTSAFMLIFLYPLYHAKFRRKSLWWIVPLFAFIWAFNRQIFTFLGRMLTQFTDYDVSISSTGSIIMLLLFILFAVFSYLIPEESQMDPDTLGMRNILLFAVLLQMFAPLHNLAMRMNYYFLPFIPLLLPRIIRCRSVRWSQVAVLARYMMLVFFVLYF